MPDHDLFLSYHRPDTDAVDEVQRLLEARGLRCFRDHRDLMPGLLWPEALEKALQQTRGVAVFLGPQGLGTWQKREMYFALDRQAKEENAGRRFPVIPVLLRGANLATGFLFLNTWIDLRHDRIDTTALDQLTTVVLGEDKDAARPTLPLCPYVGLKAFNEDNAAFFFGREAFSDRLLGVTLQKPLVAVVGPSGSGKSSVVRAGLVPQLRRQAPPNDTWDVVTFTPDDKPFFTLAKELALLEDPGLTDEQLFEKAQTIEEQLRKDRAFLLFKVERLLKSSGGTDRLLIVVDQFEELFTLTPEADRRPFAETLLHNLDRAPYTLVLTLRADFYSPAIALSRDLSDRMEQGLVNLGSMTRGELKRVIEEPAKRVGLQFDEGLVTKILKEVGDEPGKLPLLEFALTELWVRRADRLLTHTAYDKDIKGISGAIATRADETYNRLSPAERQVARKLFTRMVRIARPEEQGKDTRRRLNLQGLDEAEMKVVQELADARLLVTSGETMPGEALVEGAPTTHRQKTAEITHEALIQKWDVLKGWLNADREFLLWRERLRTRLVDWDDKQLRGAGLAEAEHWLIERPDDLDPDECGYIQASVDERKREVANREAREQRERDMLRKSAEAADARREAEEAAREAAEAREQIASRLFRGSVGAGALLVLLLGLILYFLNQSLDQTHLTSMRLLASRAENLESEEPVTSMLLAIEALTATKDELPLPDAEQVIRNHLTPYSRGLTGHQEQIRAVAFSSDNRYLVTAGDSTARLYALDHLDEEPKVLTGHQAGISVVAFSSDSRYLVTGGRNTAWLYKLDHLNENPVALPGHRLWISTVAFSSDNRYLVTGGERTARLYALDSLNKEPTVLTGHRASIRAVVFSSDNQYLVTASYDGTARLYTLDPFNEEPNVLTDQQAVIRGVAFSSDNRYLITYGDARTARLYALDPLNKESIALTGHTSRIRGVAFSSDNRYLVTASDDGTARLYTLDPFNEEPTVLTGHQAGIDGVAFSSDNRYLVTYSDDGTARLYALDPLNEKPIVLTGHQAGITAVAFSSDNRYLVTYTFSNDGTARLYALDHLNEEPAVLTGHQDRIRTVVFSSDNRHLVTYSDDGTALLYALDHLNEKPKVLTGHQAGISAVAFSSDNRYLITASEDRTARLYTLDPLNEEPKVLTDHRDWITAVAFSSDNRYLVTASKDTTARLYELDSLNKEPTVLTNHWAGIRAVAFSSDNRYLVTADHFAARLYALDSLNKEPTVLRAPPGWITTVAFSSDNRYLITGNNRPKHLYALDPLNEKPIVLTGYQREITAVAFSSDNRYLVTTSNDRTTRLYALDPLNEKPIVLIGHQGEITAVAFSSDNRYLVTASEDRTARLYALDPFNEKPTVLTGHRREITAVAFSSDNRYLVTASEDRTARLYALDPLNEKPTVLTGHQDRIRTVAFSGDNRYLVTTSADQTARLWRLDKDALIELACTWAGRNLSEEEWRRYGSDQEYHEMCKGYPIPED